MQYLHECVSGVEHELPKFFFNDTPTTEIYTLSLHDALPIFDLHRAEVDERAGLDDDTAGANYRSEEHTSELQSPMYLVCRLLLEKKKTVNVGKPCEQQQMQGTPYTDFVSGKKFHTHYKYPRN